MAWLRRRAGSGANRGRSSALLGLTFTCIVILNIGACEVDSDGTTVLLVGRSISSISSSVSWADWADSVGSVGSATVVTHAGRMQLDLIGLAEIKSLDIGMSGRSVDHILFLDTLDFSNFLNVEVAATLLRKRCGLQN